MLIQTNTMPMFKGPAVSEHFEPAAEIVLYCGDVLDFLETVPDETAKLIVTSPPYNLGKEYESRTAIESYLDFQDVVIDRLVHKLRSDGSICWQVGNFVEDSEVFPLDTLYYPRFKKHGLKLRNRIIWRFNHGLHASDSQAAMRLFYGSQNRIATHSTWIQCEYQPSILARGISRAPNEDCHLEIHSERTHLMFGSSSPRSGTRNCGISQT